MKSKIFITVFTTIFLLSAVSATTFAWEKGHVKIVPGFEVEERWDSNIFYDPSDEKDDFITILVPSIETEFGFGTEGKHKLKAEYEAEVGVFSRYDDQNYGNHDFFGEVFMDFNDYNVTVNDEFLFTSSRAGTEFERRTLRKENTLNSIIGADFNKFSLDLGYQHFIVDYHSSLLNSIDHYENSIWTTGYVQIWPKTKGLLEYKYTNLQYPHTSGRNGNAHEVLVGLKGEITPKVTGIAKAGYKYKGYVSSSRDDFSSAVVHIALDYDPLDRLNIHFSYEREGFESIYSNNNYYTGDHFLTNVNYKFGGNWIAKMDGQYYFNDYPETAVGDSEDRQDHEWAIGCGLDYVYKEWLVAGVGYRFHQRASNISTRDYDQHVISGDVRVVF